MAHFFHLDKNGYPHIENEEIPLMLPNPNQILDTGSLAYWKSRFSEEGFSAFGLRMLSITNWPHKFELTANDHLAIKREQVFEDVRERDFPERPSRLQSLFGFCTFADANTYRIGSRHPEWPLWIVDSSDFWFGDMNIYDLNEGTDFEAIARRYWAGEQSENPLIEVLMRLPVRVVRRVE